MPRMVEGISWCSWWIRNPKRSSRSSMQKKMSTRLRKPSPTAKRTLQGTHFHVQWWQPEGTSNKLEETPRAWKLVMSLLWRRLETAQSSRSTCIGRTLQRILNGNIKAKTGNATSNMANQCNKFKKTYPKGQCEVPWKNATGQQTDVIEKKILCYNSHNHKKVAISHYPGRQIFNVQHDKEIIPKNLETSVLLK